jgi:PAS domain S-box-containing protein
MDSRSAQHTFHPARATLHILYVDTHDELTPLIEQEMSGRGIDVQIIAIHHKAMLVEQLEITRPDAVLCSMGLRDCSIQEILGITRFKYPLVPILLLPAESSSLVTDAIRLGADDYVLRTRLQRLPYALQLAIEKKQIEREKRHIEQELNMTRDLYRVVMDNAPDITTIMLKDGTVSYTNRAFAKVLSIKQTPHQASAYIGMKYPVVTITDYIYREDIDAFLDCFEQVLSNGLSEDMIARFYTGTGATLYLESRMERITTEQQTFAVIIVSRDITQRYVHEQEMLRLTKELENRVVQQSLAVEESEEQLDLQVQEREEVERQIKIAYSIINQSNDAIMLFSSDGNMIFLNGVAATSLGYTWSEIQTLKPFQICRELRTETEWRLFRHQLYRQTLIIAEIHFLRSDGEYMPVEITAKILRFQNNSFILVVAYDLAERRTHERNLEMAYHLINQTQDGIIVSEINGKIISTNSTVQIESGYSADELRTMTFTELDTLVNANAGKLRENTRLLLKRGKLLIETLFRRANGEVYPVEISNTLIQHASGRYIVSMIRDISQRRALETQVQRTQQLYGEIAKSYPNGIVFVFDTQFVCQYAGGQDFRVLGSMPDEIIGYTLFDIFPPRVADFMMMSLEPTLHGEQVHFEVRFTGNDYAFSAVPLYDHEQKIIQILAVSQNITERKQAEEMVQQQSSFLNEILNNIPISIDIKNLAGSFILFNHQAEYFSGKMRNEVVGNDNFAVYEPDIATLLQAMDMEAVRLNGETIVRERDGMVSGMPRNFIDGRKMIRLPGEGSAILGYSVDITAVKDAQRQIEIQQQFIRRVIDTSPSMIYVKDEHGVYGLVNRAMANLFGLTIEQMEGKTLEQLFFDQPERILFATAEETVRATGMPARNEESIKDASSRRLYVDVSIVPLIEEKRKNIMGVITDITVRKAAEDEMRSALEKEKEVGELKSNFVTMVSHEFRTPLTSIRSSSELLIRFGDRINTDKRNIYLKSIDESVVRMTQMMEDILFISKSNQEKIAFKPDSLDLKQLLTVIVTELQWTFSHAQERVRLSIDDSLPAFVKLDNALVRHILTNLISNALKYSPDGGFVDVSIDVVLRTVSDTDSQTFHSSEDIQTQTAHTEHQPTRDLKFVIRDYGIGIPEADQAQLFESFHRASNIRNIPGTGLGLVIVKRSVERHGGTITFSSLHHEGTTFIVRIPLVEV